MPNSGIRHIDVGPELTKAEFESWATHQLDHGTAFPANPVVRQLFYRDDEGRWYIFNGTAWIWLGGGAGMAVHGNDFHSPHFAPLADLSAHVLATLAHGVSGAIVGTTSTQTLTMKRLQPRVATAPSGDITPDVSVADIFIRTAQAAAITIANPIGTPAEGEKLIIRLLDNGTARTITWGTEYRGLEFPLPTTTVAGRLLYLGFIFNSVGTRWDLLAINQQP